MEFFFSIFYEERCSGHSAFRKDLVDLRRLLGGTNARVVGAIAQWVPLAKTIAPNEAVVRGAISFLR